MRNHRVMEMSGWLLQEEDEEVAEMLRLVRDEVLPEDEQRSRKLMLELPRFTIVDDVLCRDTHNMPALLWS